MRCAPTRATRRCAPISGTSCAPPALARPRRPDMAMQSTTDAASGLAPADTSAEQAQARAAAAARKRRRQIQVIAIRLVSISVVLATWQIFGAQVDPILFTTPIAVVKAAIVMIASGELWTYLWPSLIVLAIGLAIAAVSGIPIGLLCRRVLFLGAAVRALLT